MVRVTPTVLGRTASSPAPSASAPPPVPVSPVQPWSLGALPRGVAMDPRGVLLSDAPLLSRTPVEPTDGEGFPMAQSDKDDVADLGPLKLDVPGMRMPRAPAVPRDAWVSRPRRPRAAAPGAAALPIAPADASTYYQGGDGGYLTYTAYPYAA
ncbi:hypothetical protein [Streptomyces sp. NPDC004629]|uniref:hypothetical protein n=1 Tax=Streptomyces sp. NPDC004629 TaxID=3364705 RepID=UPI003686DB92